MKEKNKTLIKGIILLMLVAVIGTTYAYFAANITGNESTSTIVVTGGRMEIAYDNLSGTIEAFDIYPREDAWVTKNFTVTGNNTTEKEMMYKIGLKIDKNTFTDEALTYTLTAEYENGIVQTFESEQPIANLEFEMVFGYNLMAMGVFPKGEDMVHTYTFELFFKDTGENQNNDQGKEFAAHIIIAESSVNEVLLTEDSEDVMLAMIAGREEEFNTLIEQGKFIIPNTFLMDGQWSKVALIGNNIFNNSELSDITLNEGLRVISDSAFEGLNTLTTINLPSSLVYIGTSAFNGTNLSNLTLPNNLEHIGENAFLGNANITGTLNIPDSVKYIGDNAFYGTSITSANIPQNIEYLSGFTGMNISGHLTTPSTTKTIGNYAFNNTNITGLTLNEGLETIGDFAFAPILPDNSDESSSVLTGELIIPSTVKSIGNNAFFKTQITGELIIPSSVKTIGNSAFSQTNISKLTLNEGLETIGMGAFGLAENLTGILTIPSTVKAIGDLAFIGTNIDGITLNEGIEYLSGFGMTKISGELVLPSTVKEIGYEAFYQTEITNVILNEGLETIYEGAFYGTHFTTITIPSTVKSIGNNAFYSSSITEINYPGTETEWNKISIGSLVFPEGVTINYNYTGA